MAKRILPPQAYLRECFTYDPDSGALRWRGRPLRHFRSAREWKRANARFAGTLITNPTDRGYYRVGLDGQQFRMSRIIWKLQTGEEPDELDHRNLNKSDNRWSNLRHATRTENDRNKPRFRNSKSGFKGVCRLKDRPYFQARIFINGQRVFLGNFPTAEEAHEAYCNAARSHHGEFFRG